MVDDTDNRTAVSLRATATTVDADTLIELLGPPSRLIRSTDPVSSRNTTPRGYNLWIKHIDEPITPEQLIDALDAFSSQVASLRAGSQGDRLQAITFDVLIGAFSDDEMVNLAFPPDTLRALGESSISLLVSAYTGG